MQRARSELEETQRLLEAAKARLAEVEEGIASLQAKYEECVAKKQDLEFKTEQCTARLGRAEKVCSTLCPVQNSDYHHDLINPLFWMSPLPSMNL